MTPFPTKTRNKVHLKKKLFRTVKPADDTTLRGYFYVCLRFKKVLAWFAVLLRESDHRGAGGGGVGGSTEDSSDRSDDVLEYNSKLKC